MATQDVRALSARSCRREIVQLVDEFIADLATIAQIEARFEARAHRIQLLAARFNRERLNPLIKLLVGKGLAYCAGCDKLVPESAFSYYERTGTEVRTRNQYYDYEETYTVTGYQCERCKKLTPCTGKTARTSWVATFKTTFAHKDNAGLPSELLLVVPKSGLPQQPISAGGYSPWGNQHLTRYKDTTSFPVLVPGGKRVEAYLDGTKLYDNEIDQAIGVSHGE